MTNGNDSAFSEVTTDLRGTSEGTPYGHTKSHGGLTKREYFAAMALQGILANSGNHVDGMGDEEAHTKRAVGYSDALIEALNK